MTESNRAEIIVKLITISRCLRFAVLVGY